MVTDNGMNGKGEGGAIGGRGYSPQERWGRDGALRLIVEGGSSRPYYVFYVTVAIGELPREDALKGAPVFPDAKEAGDGGKKEPQDATAVRVAQQTNTLMSLIKAHESFEGSSKSSRIWLGEGLGSIPKRVHDCVLQWEFMDMSDFRPRSATDAATVDADTEKLVVLPGFEVSQPRKKPVNNFITWIQCFSRYTAAMSKHYPNCTAGFISHLLIVVKAFNEVEHPAWREYDEAYREKMASTGNKSWSGMDVALYQELCGSRQKQRSEKREVPRGTGGKRPISGRDYVCWLYNDGTCTHNPCKFPHLCELCRGNHPKRYCTKRTGPDTMKGTTR